MPNLKKYINNLTKDPKNAYVYENEKILKILIDSDDENIKKYCFKISFELLRHVCTIGSYELFEKLLTKFNVNLKNNIQCIIYLACKGGNIKIIDKILSLSDKYKLANSGLEGACCGGHVKIIDKMLKLGADWYSSGLLHACLGGHINIADKMISLGAYIHSSLKNACTSGNIQLVEKLISLGASDFRDALFEAYRNENMNIFRFLLKHISQKYCMKEEDIICQNLGLYHLEELIAKGFIEYNEYNKKYIKNNELFLFKVCYHGNPELFEKCIDDQVNLNTCFRQAAIAGHLNIIEKILTLTKNIDVEVNIEQIKDLKVLRKLVSLGANYSYFKVYDNINIEIVKFLLLNGSKIGSLKNNNSIYVKYYLLKKGFYKCFKKGLHKELPTFKLLHIQKFKIFNCFYKHKI